MDFGFSQELEQKLSLNQTQLFSLKLLSMDSYELEQYINDVQLENPFVQAEYEQEQIKINSQDFYDGEWKSRRTNDEVKSWETYTAIEAKVDKYQFFLEQIEEELNFVQNKILRYMAEMMDESGYILMEDSDIASVLKCSVREVENVRDLIKYCEPIGCGSINLIDCICFQLEQENLSERQLWLCKKIITENLQDIAKGNYGKIAKEANIDQIEVVRMVEKIKKMNPIPLNGYGIEQSKYIIPDVIIEFKENQWIISLSNTYVSQIVFSQEYKPILSSKLDMDTKRYCKEKKQEVYIIQRSLEQRRNTLMKIANVIFKYQYDFINGNGYLKPMQMSEIARSINVHESTVSRAIKNKYIQFPRGIYAIRELFQYTTINDMGVSQIKEEIRNIIEKENKKCPLSDQNIVNKLEKMGYHLSRRTVAKYREEMQIGSTRIRKVV